MEHFPNVQEFTIIKSEFNKPFYNRKVKFVQFPRENFPDIEVVPFYKDIRTAMTIENEKQMKI